MPFQRPTLVELKERAGADLDSRLEGSDARLRRANTSVLATVHAGAVHGLYGYLDFIARQVMIDQAEAEYLERHASIWGITRKAAAAATGSVSAAGTTGAVIPAGTVVQRSDGAEFTTDADAVLVAGAATATITASEAGVAGNTPAGSSLTLVSPIAGVNSAMVVAAGGLTGGADIEPDESLRERLLLRIQEPPHGGAAHDYVAWALEVAAVTRAWCYPGHLGLGTVGVTFVCDDQDGGIIPAPATVAEVQAHIDELRPMTADVTVFAPVAVPLAITIQLTPNTAAAQAAVQAELADMITRDAVPGGAILISHVREAISLAGGETNHVLVSPVADITHATGEIATLGVITWQ